MTEFMVKVLQAPVWIEQEHPFVPDSMIRVENVAAFGNIITDEEEPEDPADREPGVIYGVSERDIKRLRHYGALYTEEETANLKERLQQQGEQLSPFAVEGVAQPGEGGDQPDIADWSDEQIADHIADNKLTVNETIALSRGDRDLAEKILDAENLATDNEPRAGVVRGLETVISRANQ